MAFSQGQDVAAENAGLAESASSIHAKDGIGVNAARRKVT